MWPVSTKLIFAEVASGCIYTIFNAAQRDMLFNTHLQMHNVFDILNIDLKWTETLNVKLNRRHVTVNKWVTATEPNHLNDWFI